MNLWTFLIVCGSIWALFQILAVVVGWRFTKMRATAVVEWQDCDRKPCGCPVGGIDYSCKPCRAALYGSEDEAIAVAAGSNDDHFRLWENELRERAS